MFSLSMPTLLIFLVLIVVVVAVFAIRSIRADQEHRDCQDSTADSQGASAEVSTETSSDGQTRTR